jgi:hypothetical protein
MSETKNKLSERQKEAIQFMRDGYELGYTRGFSSYVWLQLGGCGFGGKSQKITFSTFSALEDKGLVSPKPNQSEFERPVRYQLTELGKTIQL